MVLESGDVDVQVSGRGGLPLVFLLEILLIVHVSLDIVCKGDLPVPAAQTLDAPLCLHCSWISWKDIRQKQVLLGSGGHAYKPSTWGRGRRISELAANLVYTEKSCLKQPKPNQTTQRNQTNIYRAGRMAQW